MEKLKEEIAQSVKKAGMEAELDSSDKAIKVNLIKKRYCSTNHGRQNMDLFLTVQSIPQKKSVKVFFF